MGCSASQSDWEPQSPSERLCRPSLQARALECSATAPAGRGGHARARRGPGRTSPRTSLRATATVAILLPGRTDPGSEGVQRAGACAASHGTRRAEAEPLRASVVHATSTRKPPRRSGRRYAGGVRPMPDVRAHGSLVLSSDITVRCTGYLEISGLRVHRPRRYLGPDYTADYLRRGSTSSSRPTGARPPTPPDAGRSRTSPPTATRRPPAR
jgi:hypothetical protein